MLYYDVYLHRYREVLRIATKTLLNVSNMDSNHRPINWETNHSVTCLYMAWNNTAKYYFNNVLNFVSSFFHSKIPFKIRTVFHTDVFPSLSVLNAFQFKLGTAVSRHFCCLLRHVYVIRGLIEKCSHPGSVTQFIAFLVLDGNVKWDDSGNMGFVRQMRRGVILCFQIMRFERALLLKIPTI